VGGLEDEWLVPCSQKFVTGAKPRGSGSHDEDFAGAPGAGQPFFHQGEIIEGVIGKMAGIPG
jgi:hypothetical protein